MKNNDQKKTVELTTLPNTEVFGLLNCMVNPGSIIDDVEKRARKFTIHPFYDDIAMVGVMLNPIYKLNDQREIVNTLCKYEKFSPMYINRSNVNPEEVLLDITFNNPKTSDKYVMYTSATVNKNIISNSNPQATEFAYEKMSNPVGYVSDEHDQLGLIVTFGEGDNAINVDKITSYNDIYINGNCVVSAMNQVLLQRRVLSSIHSIRSGVMLTNNTLNLSDLVGETNSVNVQITNSKNKFKAYKHIVTISIGTQHASVTQNDFSVIKYKYGNVFNGSIDGNTPASLRIIQSDNIDDVLELEFVASIPEVLEKYKYVGTQIIRINTTDDTRPFPEMYAGTTDVNKYDYCLVFDTEITDTSIKCSIPNKFLFDNHFLTWTDTSTLVVGLITADGTFTTEKPNIP